ncbi:MAG TPA: DUF262 domain-containing protein [Noviherbaspirillum sp.]|nr:DUF262 domain-containing protein [Noviherbaspirillum sp.]
MTKILERSTNNISISNFYEEYSIGKYDMSPPYQRLSVWSIEKKAFFIDSILKNLPIPPIFLRQKVNDETGKTSYEVIDGKQRLTSIVEFIEGVFPTADEADDPFHDEQLAGKMFSELEGIGNYKKLFWRYLIPVEYIDSSDPEVIDRIFDRLNRNGEPLTGQELRHSNYYNTRLLKLAYSMSKMPFWQARLEATDKARMEDVEFVSELLFVLLEKGELTASDKDLDDLYAKYSNDDICDWADLESQFQSVTSFMKALEIDYTEYKVYGVSHLYGIWCFSRECLIRGITPEKVAEKVSEFFELTRVRKDPIPESLAYKQSMSNRTKSQTQRIKRKNALLSFCGIKI